MHALGGLYSFFMLFHLKSVVCKVCGWFMITLAILYAFGIQVLFQVNQNLPSTAAHILNQEAKTHYSFSFLFCSRVGILAFHKALSDQPRDPMVVAAFCLAVHNGGDILGGVKMVKKFTMPHDDIFHELSEPQNLNCEALVDEIVDFAASVKQALYWMTDSYYVSQAMAEYHQAPCSDLVSTSFSFPFFLFQV